jgi:hypothetical protein
MDSWMKAETGYLAKRKRLQRLSLVLAVLLLALELCVGAACSSTEQDKDQTTTIDPLDSPSTPTRGYFKGSLPNGPSGIDMAEAYASAANAMEFVPVWGRPTPFYDLAADLSGGYGSLWIQQLIRGNGMFPLIHMSFLDARVTLKVPPGLGEATLSSSEWREAYRQAALDVVRAAKPKYFSLGNEVNRWYERYGAQAGDANGFQNWVSLYNEVYDAVKALSPQTKVFCTFAREMVDELREADLQVLTMFDSSKLDLLVFTSYPYSVRKDSNGAVLAKPFNRPTDIPDDYYSRALAYIPGKALGFSEIAWTSADFYGGEEAQADFLTQVAGRLTTGQGANLELLGWCWIYDLSPDQPVGLIRPDGTEKAAYGVWRNL